MKHIDNFVGFVMTPIIKAGYALWLFWGYVQFFFVFGLISTALIALIVLMAKYFLFGG